MNEPTTVLTDYALAAVSAFAMLLFARGVRQLGEPAAGGVRKRPAPLP